ncbi:hypothetical protein DFH07DRAFT_85986 [Mycena maculata]|uniref:Uncharacterized protein n=1 Tax=Mycena maculata TaxID=230809 RepID=A0AAD7MYT7_9AGAR|nr:hypothetical protein DFH07DRAFT_85986 [Mycena maculata]
MSFKCVSSTSSGRRCTCECIQMKYIRFCILKCVCAYRGAVIVALHCHPDGPGCKSGGRRCAVDGSDASLPTRTPTQLYRAHHGRRFHVHARRRRAGAPSTRRSPSNDEIDTIDEIDAHDARRPRHPRLRRALVLHSAHNPGIRRRVSLPIATTLTSAGSCSCVRMSMRQIPTPAPSSAPPAPAFRPSTRSFAQSGWIFSGCVNSDARSRSRASESCAYPAATRLPIPRTRESKFASATRSRPQDRDGMRFARSTRWLVYWHRCATQTLASSSVSVYLRASADIAPDSRGVVGGGAESASGSGWAQMLHDEAESQVRCRVDSRSVPACTDRRSDS